MIYFHAGDKYQFQKYGMARSRLLSYPDKPKLSKKYRKIKATARSPRSIEKLGYRYVHN